jgi:predicted AAA+ superfamily ATPase
MKRDLTEKLTEWKQSPRRKPLILHGARQVGKTWIMRDFAQSHYENSVYVNFENNPAMRALFEIDFDMRRIVEGIELLEGQKVVPGKTLLIFDEIQEVPKALSSLKYFNENLPEQHIVCAGSLLGMSIHPGSSFPVGKVEILRMRPLSFGEFLDASGHGQYRKLIVGQDFEMLKVVSAKLIELLKKYYYVGGMPEPVSVFTETADYDLVRKIQNQLINNYVSDFSKHAPKEIIKSLSYLWDSIPTQLAKENNKFVYGQIKSGARAAQYENAISWLVDAGLVCKNFRATTPNVPLKAYWDLKAFKLFVNDVGLLSCLAGLRKSVLAEGDRAFKEFKGALTEQYALQQLVAADFEPCYWSSDKGVAEVDFLIDTNRGVVPVEVKAETNLKAKSLRVYRDKYSPELSVRVSMAGYDFADGLLSVPLYAMEAMKRLL